MQKKQNVLVIVGPTSSGKSALAVDMAREWNGEVISADSRQVYRGLDIGTGKITTREMRGVRHHLLNVASPKKVFTAHRYIALAREAIDAIAARGKLPIITGGTGFYIDALLGRTVLPDVPANLTLRARLEKKTAAQLFSLLKKLDPRRASTIEPHNKRRLIRALEIVNAIGSVPKYTENGSLYNVLWIGLNVPLPELEKKIATRLTARIKQGLIAEGKRLHTKGLSYSRMEELGLEYRALSRLLQKEVPRETFESGLCHDIRRYAKRQITYWKRNKDIKWFSPSRERLIRSAVRKWIQG